MRAFMGVVRFGPLSDVGRERAALSQIAEAAGRAFAIQESGNAVFLQIGALAAPDPYAPPLSPGALFAGRTFLHNRQELSGQLGLHPKIGDVALLRAVFEARGDAGLAMLRGNFSFAHWNGRRRELTLARDYGRGESLYFYRAADFIAFASHLPDLLSHPDVPRDLDEVVVANFLARDIFQHSRTMFRGIERVPPRSAATVSSGRIAHRTYWSPEIRDDPLYPRDEDYIERARELLDQAVSRVLSDSPNFAVMASGGLDSSAILSNLARRGVAPIPCYTLVPEDGVAVVAQPHRYPDERPNTELLARMYPALKFRYLSPSVLQRFAQPDDRHFQCWPTPSYGISLTRIYAGIYEAIAADGHKVVLSGSAGNFGLSWAGHDLLPQLAGQCRFLTLLREAQAMARHQQSSISRILAHELVMPFLPPPVKRAVAKLCGRGLELTDLLSPLRPEIVRELDLPRVWSEDGFDPNPLWRRRSRQQRAERLFDRPQLTHDTGPMYETRFGIELRDPLADRDLLEFSLNVPEQLYRRNGVPRWLMRAILADRVPTEILQEKRRGAQGTHWFDEMDARRDQIAADVERMESSLTADRLVDIPRLKRLIEHWPKDAQEAETHFNEYMITLEQAVHVYRFVRWVTGGNA